jgi:hypothetical protein
MVALFMLTDMFIRLWNMLGRKAQGQDEGKLVGTAPGKKTL